MKLDANNPVRLELDQRSLTKCLSYLLAMEQAGPRVVATALNAIALQWMREIKRHMPVDNGLARASVTVDPANPAENPVVAQVGTNVPYVVHLEFAHNFYKGKHGSGGVFSKVSRWQNGDPPITRWYAKDADLATLEMSSRRHTKLVVKKLEKAYSPGTEEFMPPFRASWILIAPQSVAWLRNRLANLMKTGKVSA